MIDLLDILRITESTGKYGVVRNGRIGTILGEPLEGLEVPDGAQEGSVWEITGTGPVQVWSSIHDMEQGLRLELNLTGLQRLVQFELDREIFRKLCCIMCDDPKCESQNTEISECRKWKSWKKRK